MDWTYNHTYSGYEASVTFPFMEGHTVDFEVDASYIEDLSPAQAYRQVPTIIASNDDANGVAQYQQNAFDLCRQAPQAYEARLQEALWDLYRDMIQDAIQNEENREIVQRFSLNTPDGLRHAVSFKGMSLLDYQIEDIGVIAYDFDCAWDPEHGVSLLMWKTNLLGISGIADFMCRGNILLEHAKCCRMSPTRFDIL